MMKIDIIVIGNAGYIYSAEDFRCWKDQFN